MVTNQAYLFLIFTITGMLIGILFDIFRAFRRSFKTKDWMTYIQDILFWALTGLILLYTIFTFSDGEIRFYMFIGAFLGSMFYMVLFSQYFIYFSVIIIKFIKKILMIMFYPLRLLLHVWTKMKIKRE